MKHITFQKEEEETQPKKMNAMSFQNYALLLKDIIL